MKPIYSPQNILRHNHNTGFTLVELMITLVIMGFIIAGIYFTYLAQQRIALAQEQVTEMQQNIRASCDILEREIRMAGYDPLRSAGATFQAAAGNSLRFTMDLNRDGDALDTDEDMAYSLYVAADGIQKLGRNDNTGGLGNQAVAEDIDSLEFYYVMKDGTKTLTPATLADIRSVQISILARAQKADLNFTNSATYTTASSAVWGPYNDNLRRRLFITTVHCRNMGL